MIAQIATGHVDLADVLFLISFIVFAVLWLITILGIAAPARFVAMLTPLGLALFALAWFVL